MGKFIVIEGGDGAGKGTQTAYAIQALEASGEKVTTFDFPRYKESMAGKLVRESLDGEHGDFLKLDPRLASIPYTLDRVGARDDLRRALRAGTVICNRFTPSNAMYQGAKFIDPAKQMQFIEWLEQLEYDEMQLPKPDLVIYLYVPFEISHQLVEKRAAESGDQGKIDQYEADHSYQRKVIDLYLATAQARPDWQIINCVRDGVMRTVDSIHNEVMSVISRSTGRRES